VYHKEKYYKLGRYKLDLERGQLLVRQELTDNPEEYLQEEENPPKHLFPDDKPTHRSLEQIDGFFHYPPVSAMAGGSARRHSLFRKRLTTLFPQCYVGHTYKNLAQHFAD
jgi:hypothetical protein